MSIRPRVMPRLPWAILSLGASLDITVTAEGVERQGQLEWLRSRRCDEVQGFLLARPLSAQQLEEQFLAKLTAPAAAIQRARS